MIAVRGLSLFEIRLSACISLAVNVRPVFLRILNIRVVLPVLGRGVLLKGSHFRPTLNEIFLDVTRPQKKVTLPREPLANITVVLLVKSAYGPAYLPSPGISPGTS
jgi:hypothetical protein